VTVGKEIIGENNFQMSKLILGWWRLTHWNYNDSQILDLIAGSLELGITSHDHADIYGGYLCEEMFGNVLKANPSLRKKMELVTKCGIVIQTPQRPEHTYHYYDTGKDHIIKSAERSLTNFGTDYIDLLLIHRPDQMMNADDSAEAFSELKKSGKVLNFGVSNFMPDEFDLLQSRLDFPLVTNQIEFSVLCLNALEDGTLNKCQQLKTPPMIWSPFAGGRLFTEGSEQASRVREELSSLSPKYNNAAIDQLALAWILKHPSNTLPVIGTGKMDRVKSAVNALDINLLKEDWFRIWTASKGYEVP
jgi:predicted oxidoreductase